MMLTKIPFSSPVFLLDAAMSFARDMAAAFPAQNDIDWGRASD